MGLFSSSNKDPEADFIMLDGIPSVSMGTTVTLGISGQVLTVKDRGSDTLTYTLPACRIKNIYIGSEAQIINKKINVHGEIVVNGIVIEALRALIGDGDKHRYFMIIFYDFKQTILFEITNEAKTLRLYNKLNPMISN